MRVLFISTYGNLPAGMRYIASYLEKHGHDVCLSLLKYPSESSMRSLLASRSPEIIGFTCYTLDTLKVLDAAGIAKMILPQAKIVLGNIHATVFHKSILEQFSFIDYIVIGEGEVPMKELLDSLCGQMPVKDVANIAYRDGSGIVCRSRSAKEFVGFNEVSDFLKRRVPVELITANYRRFSNMFRKHGLSFQRPAYIFASRGCSYSCDYCSENRMSGHNWRIKSPERVVDTIEKIYRDHHIIDFSFEDPLFTCNKQWVNDFCRELDRRGLKIRWSVLTHPGYLSKDLISMMNSSGCVHITFGLDCLTAEKIFEYRKIKVDYMSLAGIVRLIRSLEMTVRINIIVGWPDEKLRYIFKGIRHLVNLMPTHLVVYPFQYIPGSLMFDRGVEEGLISPDYWMDRKRPAQLWVHRTGNNRLTKYVKLRLHQFIVGFVWCVTCRGISGKMYFIAYYLESLLNSVKYLSESIQKRILG
ncbi:B12-binding domain-containing radical SAM protein [Elusimicrobiota bacterium]